MTIPVYIVLIAAVWIAYIAAKERLRRLNSGEGLIDVYGYDSVHDMVDYDKLIIYDAEHDSEPATVEWLTECGLVHNEVFRIICNAGPVGNQRTLAICGVGFVKLNPTSRRRARPLLRVFNERNV